MCSSSQVSHNLCCHTQRLAVVTAAETRLPSCLPRCQRQKGSRRRVAASRLSHLSVSVCLGRWRWGRHRHLAQAAGLMPALPGLPIRTHCFQVLYLRVGLDLDEALLTFLLSTAFLISVKNNQPVCSMLRNKKHIISTIQTKAT